MNIEWMPIKRRCQLKIFLNDEKNYELRFKLAFLNMVLQLQDVNKTSKTMSVSIPTAYRWINAWNQDGKEGLRSKQGMGGGKPPKLTKEQLKELEKILMNEKEWWLTSEVRKLLKDRFGVEYSEDQVVKILKNFKMNHAKPYPHDYRKPENAQQILENQVSLVLELLKKENIPKEKISIGFMDETGSQTTANTVRVWSFGRPVITKNTTKLKVNTAGYYAIIGNSVEGNLINSKKESISEFLTSIKEANVEYDAIVVIIDNLPSHKSNLVKENAKELGIYLVFLPPYSPDLNPIEFIWKSLKRILSLLFVMTEDEIKNKVRLNFQTLSESLSFAKKWIEHFLKGTPFYQMLVG